jgi:hypothetical protein
VIQYSQSKKEAAGSENMAENLFLDIPRRIKNMIYSWDNNSNQTNVF